MKPWSDFYDLLSSDVPGCPFGAQLYALRRAAIDFCEQSKAWKYTHPDIAVVVGTNSYPFAPPPGAIVHTVDYAEFNGCEISTKIAADQVRLKDWRHDTGVPQYILGGPASFTVVPNPDTAGTLSMTVILKPSILADGIDDNVSTEYREAIVHGACSILMSSPKKQYTDLALGAWHRQQFQIMAGRAGVRIDQNFTRAPLETTIMRRR